jgi:WXG100 family type VII secretion target
MSQAIVDPEQLRRFAQNLKRFNADLQNQLMTLHGQMKNLGQSWRDKEQQKFTEEFEQTMLALSKFIDAVDMHVPFLLRKADRAEEYLRQR